MTNKPSIEIEKIYDELITELNKNLPDKLPLQVDVNQVKFDALMLWLDSRFGGKDE